MRKILVVVMMLVMSTQGEDENEEVQQNELLGFRVSKYNSIFPFTYSNDVMLPELAEGVEITLRIIGHLADVSEMSLTPSLEDCKRRYDDSIAAVDKESREVASATLTTPVVNSSREVLHFCFKISSGEWKHQGRGYWAKLVVEKRFMTMSNIICGIVLCTALASALNASLLRLMSLDVVDLKTRVNTGSESEKIFCKALLGMRKRAYLVSMALLLGVVFFKVAVTVLLKFVVNGWTTVVVGSLLSVLIVEVAPRLSRSKVKNSSLKENTESSNNLNSKDDQPSINE